MAQAHEIEEFVDGALPLGVWLPGGAPGGFAPGSRGGIEHEGETGQQLAHEPRVARVRGRGQRGLQALQRALA